jgi:hypothetical protein
MRLPLPMALTMLTMAMTSSGRASVLQVCPEDGIASAQTAVTASAGPGRRLVLMAAPQPGCAGIELGVPQDDVLALYALGPGSPAANAGMLTLTAPGAEGAFRIASVESHDNVKGPAREPLPLRHNLLPLLTGRPFGAEERVELTRDGAALLLRCRPGSRPAGAVLSGPWFMTRARASLHWQAQGDGGFALALADAALAAGESATLVAHALGGGGHALLPGEAFDPASWQHFTLACPAQGGQLRLDDLRLEPAPMATPLRSAWRWSAAAWATQPRQVLQHARQYGIGTLFITVPVRQDRVQAPRVLAAFIRMAGAAGVAVWTVDGDPRMVLPGEERAATGRISAYAAYNRAVGPDARLAGVQFDIEHYLLPGYGSAAAQLDARYAALAQALRAAAGALPLDFVVPFWWHDRPRMLAALEQAATSVTVMDYRTDPAQVVAFAQPFLDWGARHRKPVRIALEAGAVAPERQRRYQRADSGELWQVEVDGQRVLVLLATPRANPYGPAYRMLYERALDGSATTFHGREPALLGLLPALERDLSAWESFAGVALHELR